MKNCDFHSIADKSVLESIRNSDKSMPVILTLYRKDKHKTQNLCKDDISHTFLNCLKTLQTYGKPLYSPLYIYILRIYIKVKGISYRI